LRFSFPGFKTKSFPPSLGGRSIRYKPLVPITVIGALGQEARQILVDPGSDDVVFPLALASRIGVDLTHALPGQSRGVGSTQPISLLFAPVILLLDDGTERSRWRAVVGFTAAPLRFALLGIAGGIEYFRTTFDVDNQEILMVPQPSIPLTQDLIP
jgi:hypothetical protein